MKPFGDYTQMNPKLGFDSLMDPEFKMVRTTDLFVLSHMFTFSASLT